MTRVALWIFPVGALIAALRGPEAGASQPATASSPVLLPASAGAAAAVPAPAPRGLAVVALPGATDAAWPLAQAVYSDATLRPSTLDDAMARLLCGQAVGRESPQAVLDLADTVAALRGDDAPTRALLGTIATRFRVRALLVVQSGPGGPSARPFLGETGTFDAATYSPDDPMPPIQWSKASRSLSRAFGLPPAGTSAAPALAVHEAPLPGGRPPSRRAFYESGWFWGALGAAAVGAGAAFLATRDSKAPTIHLQLQVPR